ncbi:MAG: hypothetical protein DMD35_19590 [Gemmatimonadetes bacterium]|nr:MAG: hypothetical protein DMD35_19590 [Gemmatimonadota bacterium]
MSRFLADAMLGRLARWLRAIGCDTAQLPVHARDVEVVDCARHEDRVLLTRDRHLLRELRPPRAVEIIHDEPLEQLRAVVAAFAIARPAAFFTRCMIDNTVLHEVPLADVADRIPPLARETRGPITQCATCGRVYWRGSHARRMEHILETVFPPD